MKYAIAIVKKDSSDFLKNYKVRFFIFFSLVVFYIILLLGRTPDKKVISIFSTFSKDKVNYLYKVLDITIFDSQTAFVLFNTHYFYALDIVLMLPLVLSCLFILSEKEQKTIESLFMLPINDSNIFMGKIIASIIPSFFLTILSYLITIVLIFFKFGPSATNYFLDLKWWILHFVTVLIYSIFTALFGFCISIKSETSRSSLTISSVLLINFFIFVTLLLLFPILHSTIIFNNKLNIYSSILGITLSVISLTIAKGLFNHKKIICND